MRASLRVSRATLGESGPCYEEKNYHLWVIASQDCDLDSYPISENSALVELRPVFDEGVPSDYGIRSRKLRLSDQYYTESEEPRLHVSPALLMTFLGGREGSLSEARTLAFKTWLGLRYDRPAVPPEHLPLMRAVVDALSKRKELVLTGSIHDVLVQVSANDPPEYVVFIVIEHESVRDDVRAWVAEKLAEIDPAIGILENLQAGTKAQLSLEFLESSYAADLTKITWSKPTGPIGAV